MSAEQHRSRCGEKLAGLALALLADGWARARGGLLTALTVNHGLRPDSLAEAVRVGEWLAARGIAHRIIDGMGAKPGERWQYSDPGFFLLGMILEKASGKPWSEFLGERIFRPLELSATSTQDLTSIVKHRVHGYGRR